MIIIHANIITADNTILQDGWLQIDGAIIADFGIGEPPSGSYYDAQGAWLLPGFIDIHIHGAVGADVMDADSDGLHHIARFLATQGVTSFLPTTLTDSRNAIQAALNAVQSAMSDPQQGAQILGVHLEGPYLNPNKVGAQNPAYVRSVDNEEFSEFLATDNIKIVSLAPEIDGAHTLIKQAGQHDIISSAAHTAATYDQMQTAIETGLRHSTHTYNAMPSLHHRQPGGMAALWLDERITCELIADNIHVHPVMMDLLYRIKGADKLILVSDAMRATGLGDGEYRLGEHAVIVKDGRATLEDGTLAGSLLTLPQALKNLHQATQQPLSQLWRTTSYNAARSLNIHHTTGRITRGHHADCVLLNPDFTIHTTLIAGQIAYRQE